MGQRQSQPTEPSATTTTTSVVGTTNPKKDFDDSKLHPSSDDARSHNFGQPVHPLDNKGASKQQTDCRVQQRASLQCIEENYENKDVACAQYFENYKKCRREEHERKLERNARGY